MSFDHTESAHLDTPKERALRDDYDDADREVQELKRTIKKVRMVPLSEEAEAWFYWQRRAERAEELLRKNGLIDRLPPMHPALASRPNQATKGDTNG